MIGLPSTFTVGEPPAVSVDMAMVGEGTGVGPPGVGVLHASGNHCVMPLLEACTSVRLFAFVEDGMGQSSGVSRRPANAAARSGTSEAPHTSVTSLRA